MSMTGGLAAVSPEQLEDLKSGTAPIDDLLFPEDEDQVNSCDLYKAWNGISFLLEKIGGEQRQILKVAVLGGEPFGEDLGYGPAMFLTPTEVKEIAGFLADIDDAAFRAAFDADEMESADIYGFNKEDAEQDLAFFSDHYGLLRDFYESASESSHAVIQYLV